MTDEAITNGIYMKTLSRKEALVVMADIVLAGDIEHGRYRELLDVAGELRRYYPNNVAVLIAPAAAADGMAQREFIGKYPRLSDVPPALRSRLDSLAQSSSDTLNHAYALGWRDTADAAKIALQRAAAGARENVSIATLPQR